MAGEISQSNLIWSWLFVGLGVLGVCLAIYTGFTEGLGHGLFVAGIPLASFLWGWIIRSGRF